MKTSPVQRQENEKRSFFGNPKPSFPVQAKLAVNTPGDAHEKEADAVADKVMRMPQTTGAPTPSGDREEGLQRAPQDQREEDQMKTGTTDPAPLMRKPAMPEQDRMLIGEHDAAPLHRPAAGMDEEDNMRDGGVDLAPLQRKEQAAGRAGGDVSASFAQSLQSSKGGGNPLPGDVRQQMETGIGADFSKVRIHTGSQAAQLSNNIQAQAFTHGSDIYFNEGKYSPNSSSGKHLLAHELAHTVQQQAAPAIQRDFKPEDAAAEMVGRKFKLNRKLYVNKIEAPAGTEVTITSWDNASHSVGVTITLGKTRYSTTVDKLYLQTVPNTTAGIYEYKAGVTGVQSEMTKKAKEIEDFKATEPQYKKFNTMKIYNTEMANKEGLQEKRYTDLNQKLIQETMFNALDPMIKKWVDYYNGSIGVSMKWDKLDANLVKSMIFQESQMGTSGTHLLANPAAPSIAPKTRFNVGQAVDSSGPLLMLMIEEYDKTAKGALETQFKYSQVKTDVAEAMRIVKKKDEDKKKLTEEEEKIYVYVQKFKSGDKINWNLYYYQHPVFTKTLAFFYAQTTPHRNFSYDFWIQAAVRWLFEKRKNTSSWIGAVKAYNGSGSDAEDYKGDVDARNKAAAAAAKSGQSFIPKHEY